MSDKPKTFVRPCGDLHKASYMLVGEQPGKTEILKGQPFVGAAGRVLDECLKHVGINRSDCYITNVFKDLDQPLAGYIKFTSRHVTLQCDRAYEYLKVLKEEVQRYEGKVIVAFGNVPLWALTERVGVMKWRGSVLPCRFDNRKLVIPTPHPATIIPPKMQYLNKYLIQYDLRKAIRVHKGEWSPPQRQLKIDPTYDETLEFLERCKQQGLKGHYVAYDIEILPQNFEVSCISFALSPSEVISIPFIWRNRANRWTPDQELVIWQKIAEILENPQIRKVGQNLSFDAHFLLKRYGIHAKGLEDTMIAQQILMSEFPKGLDFITSIWTDENYYKDEGKTWFKQGGGSWEQLWIYNALDSAICMEAFPKQLEALHKQGNMATYRRQSKLIEPLVFMQEHGIRVDLEGMEKWREELQEEMTSLLNELHSIVGYELNPHSPKQLANYFYVEKGLKPYLKKGRPSVDNIALKRLIRKGIREAVLISKIRGLNKIISNYLDPSKYDSDGRIRCSYNPVGTRFSRLSSSANIFGTGMNLQNVPHKVAQFFLPDEGYVAYSFDLSQAENRIVAYVGKIESMIEAFESGKDVHSLTAALIFGDPYEQIREEAAKDIPCNLGDGTKTKRFWGKKANHGLNYDLSYKTFALYYEIPESQAKFIVNAYHKAYPGVRNGFHAYVKKCLAENRTITNLMGRKTLFLDKWGDQLFKDAYACIPQGTVGDVINERGINFIYYNQSLFRPLVLLNQVHDSIEFELPLEIGWREHARMLLEIKHSLEQPLKTHYGREFVIPADLTIMPINFYKEEYGHELKSAKIPDNIDDFAKLLEQTYNEIMERHYGKTSK